MRLGGQNSRAMRALLPTSLVLLSLTASGWVMAQPAPDPLPPVTEEAPPKDVVAPAPMAAPPVVASEIKPATPPKVQVAPKPAESTQKRARRDVAILQALDKVTAETVRFEARVGQPVRYKTLVITVRACEESASDEPVDDAMAYLTVESQPRSAPGKPTPAPRQVFRGWMYASSPGLNPLEHPVYDAWLITCRATSPVIASTR
jgi:hypothetical protein